MTQRLYEMFKEKYPHKWNGFSIYGAMERIELSLLDKSFIDKGNLISLDEINRISKKHFNNFYELNRGDSRKGVYVVLNPLSSIKYDSYFGHSFYIPKFHAPLDIEISTGNRGRVDLTNEQRKKYFNFVNDLFLKFKENALK